MKNSKIEWCHHTFNPWWGCVKISPGCKHCYAEGVCIRFEGPGIWGPADTTDRRTDFSAQHWSGPGRWNRAAERAGERHRVFCASMADVFEDHATTRVNRARLWGMIDDTPSLDWLLLTKRPHNIPRLIPTSWRTQLPSNVWLGVSAENQKYAVERIPRLIEVTPPAAVLFVSYEPALGPVDLLPWLGPEHGQINWVIAGAESGTQRRPMQEDWVRDVRDQCATRRAVFLYKQKIEDGKRLELRFSTTFGI